MKRISILLFLFVIQISLAQVGIGTDTPNGESILDVESTDKGILIPRLELTNTSSAAPLGSHVAGMIVYNIATAGDVTPGFYYNDGSKWIRVSGTDASDADLRFIGANNHITQDAGNGSNGTNAGSGSSNVLIGLDTGAEITSGSSNIGIGEGSYASYSSNPATGSSNVAVGEYALGAIESGSGNIGFGTGPGQSLTTGNGNLLFGDSVAAGLIDGDSNIVIGGASGNNIISSDDNIIIGKESRSFDDSGNQLSIGNLIYGNGLDGRNTTISTGNIGIGENEPTNRLHVTATADPLKLEGLQTDNAATSLLVVDGSGVVGTQLTSNFDATDDPWLTDPTNDRVFLSTLSTGSARIGSQVVIKDNSDIIIGANDRTHSSSSRVLEIRNTTNSNRSSELFLTGTGPSNGTGGLITGADSSSSTADKRVAQILLGREGNSGESDGQIIFKTSDASGSGTVLNNVAGLDKDGDLRLHNYPGSGAATPRDDSATTTPANFLYTDANGNVLSGPTSLFDADLRLVGTNNHITQDAGFGSTGDSAGTGDNNIGIGQATLNAITTGTDNIAMGENALNAITTGSRNVVLGLNTASALDDDSDNIIIGNNAAQNLNLRVDGSNSVNSSSVIIGLNAASDAAPLVGGNIVGLVAIGASAGQNTNRGDNTFVGVSSGQNNTTGDGNTFIGRNSGANNTTGRQNTFLGQSSGVANTTGDRNTFIGNQSALGNTTGNDNIMIGGRAAFRNTTGNFNTIIGRETAVNVIDGDDNVVLGGSSADNMTGNDNIIIGKDAADNLTSGNKNIIIGNNIQAVSTTDNNQLNIGNIVYGNSIDGTAANISTGNIGIGQNTPTNRLHITPNNTTDDPLRIDNLQPATGAATDLNLVVDANGVVKTSPLSVASAKTLQLPAEYAGAVLLEVGTPNADVRGAYDGTQNVYRFTTTQTTAQVYEISVMIQLPQNFDSWGTGTDDIVVNGTTGVTVSSVSVAGIIGAGTNPNQAYDVSATSAAGDVIRVVLQVSAISTTNGGIEDAGTITLNYNGN